jgi:hypothetical protein
LTVPLLLLFALSFPYLTSLFPLSSNTLSSISSTSIT